jgi:hypothetical protein
MFTRLGLLVALALGMIAPALAQTPNTSLYNFGSAPVFQLTSPTDGQCLVYSSANQDWINAACSGGGGSGVTSFASANGFAGSVTTNVATLSTSISGPLKGASGAIAASAASDISGLYGGASGTGTLCLTTNCIMTTPNLGTPSAINLANAVFPSGVITTAQILGPPVIHVSTTPYAPTCATINGTIVEFDTGSSAFTLPVTTASGCGNGFGFDTQVKTSSTITITPTTSTINGAATLAMATGTGVSVSTDSTGSNYAIYNCTACSAGITFPLTTTQGGSGIASPTIHNLMVAEGSSPFNLVAGATNCLVGYASSSVDPTCETAAKAATFNVINGNLIFGTATAAVYENAGNPTIASGFGTSPTILGNSGSALFSVTVGSSPGGAGVITFPATARAEWACSAQDLTSNSTIVVGQTATSTTTATFAAYSRTTGLASSFTAADVIQFICGGH